MCKGFFSNAAIIVAGIIAGAGLWLVSNQKNDKKTYQDILDDSLQHADKLLSIADNDGNVVAKLVTLKRIRESQVAFNLIRRYESGKTTSTLLSVTFNIQLCPTDKQVELEHKNEILIKNYTE